MAQFDLAFTPEKNPETEDEAVDNEILVHLPSEGEVHNLNPTAAFVWDVADGSVTLEEIVDVIDEEMPDQSRQVIEEDVVELVEELKQKNLIH